jgi:hypothetical protein
MTPRFIALRVLIASLIMIQCCVTGVAGGVATLPSTELKVDILIPPGMPITIDSATVDRRRVGGVLKYRVTNQSDEAVKLVRASLSFYQDGTRANTSYGLGYEWDLPPRSSKEVTTEIGKELAEEELLLIVVSEVEGENSLWKVNWLKLDDAIKNYIEGKPYSLPKTELWEAVKKRDAV